MAKQKPDRKRRWIRLIALVLTVLLAGGAVFTALFTMAYAEPLTQTALTVKIDEALGGAYVTQTTSLVNQTGESLFQVLFSIQLNALRRAETVPVEAQDFALAYPGGFTPGGAQLIQVEVNGKPANWGAQGEGETFVRVDCDLAPGDTAEFTFLYEILLPHGQAFAGTDELGWRLSFFTLAPVVYDREITDFAPVTILPTGSAMYFDEQQVTMAVDAPDTYAVISGGNQLSAPGSPGRTLTTVRFDSARDVSLVLSRRCAQQTRVGEVTVCASGIHPASNARAAEVAQNAVQAFTQLFGPCPFDRIDIVETGLTQPFVVHSGSVWVDEGTYVDAAALERAVATGVAQMWFGQSVMANPENEPWLTEAVSAYAGLLYFEAQYGRERFLTELNKTVLDALSVTIPGMLTPDGARSYFSTKADYDLVVVGRGTAVLHEVRNAIGDQAFYAALSRYYQDNRGRNVTRAQFTQALSDAAGRDMSLFLSATLDTISEYVNQNLAWYE